MAWTVSDAQARAESYLDEEVEDTDAIIWANDFLRDKVDSRFYARDIESYAAEEDTWYDLPSDFVAVVEVRDALDNLYGRYLYDNGQIRFSAAGTYTLTYRAMPVAIAAAGATVPLSDMWLSAMAYFIASRYRSKDDPEDQDAMVKMAECDKNIKRAMGQQRATNNPMRKRLRW